MTQPALVLAETDFVEEIAARLAAAGIQVAVHEHESGPIITTTGGRARRSR